MGLFGSSSKKKERKEAMKALKSFEHNRRSKITDQRAADPSKAMTELQPYQVNQETDTQPLSHFAYKDVWGNDIKEPDLTNPTRHRFERPLDTIRSFQESIDRQYRRNSYYDGASSRG